MSDKLECEKLLEEASKNGEQVFELNPDFQEELKKALLSNQKLEKNIENPYEKEFLEFVETKLAWQQKAKKALAKAISLFNKVWKTEGVLATLFFAWPTGVGKTELAKLLAEFLTWDKDNLTIIQWAELQESHDSKRLFWAPPSYVGFDQPPLLSDSVLFAKKIKKPHPLINLKDNFAIIVVDEAEKMHPDVIQSLLWALNEWKVTLSTWKETNLKVNFSKTTDLKNTIWIFTSNIWTKELFIEKNTKHVWLIKEEDSINTDKIFDNAFKEYFSPEFRWRIDYKIIFEELKDDNIDQIIDIHLNKIREWLHQEAYDIIDIQITENLRNYFKQSVNKELGARNMAKLIHKIIDNALAGLKSNKQLDTAVLTWIELNQKIIITFDLKPDHEKYEFPSEKIIVSFSWEKLQRVKSETTQELVDTYKQKNTQIIDIGKYHTSTLSIVKTLTSKWTQILSEREETKDFQKQAKQIKEAIISTFSPLDFQTIHFVSLCKIVENTLDNQTPWIKDIQNDMQKPYKFLNNLAKDLWEPNLVNLYKNKIKKTEKWYTPEQSEILNNISNLDNNLYFTKKVKIIAFMLMELDNKFLQKTGKFLAKKVLVNIAKYFNSIY